MAQEISWKKNITNFLFCTFELMGVRTFHPIFNSVDNRGKWSLDIKKKGILIILYTKTLT